MLIRIYLSSICFESFRLASRLMLREILNRQI